MALFLLASLSPAILIAAGAVWGGVFPVVALLWMTVCVHLLDRVGLRLPPIENADIMARRITTGLGLVHLGVMPVVVWGLVRLAETAPGQAVALGLAAGLYFGQVANANAHELIHAPGRVQRRLGAAVYSALLFGHHVSAHRLVHHVHVASDADPNSARGGEGFYRFWPRAWAGSFRAGLDAVNRQRARQDPAPLVWTHPYLGYAAGAVAALAVAAAIGGLSGVVVWCLVAGYAQMQLLLADYVQHYGLRRTRAPDGTLERAGVRHSWNAPHVYSRAMMLNAPHHSDHHMHPARVFPELRLDPAVMPVLPASLPVMAMVALVPTLWRRIMDPRVRAWRKATAAGRRDSARRSAM